MAMNYSLLSRSRRSGFTLVELLVVIAIIAILAGVAVVGFSNAIAFAKRTKANATANQISTAVQNYYVEYGVYPTAPGGAGDDYYAGDDTGSAHWAPLIIALCGNINPATGAIITGNAVPNTRAIGYLSPTHSDVDITGRMVNPFATLAAGVATVPAGEDPYFFMVVDTDYSGAAGDSGAGNGAMPDFTNTAFTHLANGTPGGAAVWCSCNQNAAGANYKRAFWAHTY